MKKISKNVIFYRIVLLVFAVLGCVSTKTPEVLVEEPQEEPQEDEKVYSQEDEQEDNQEDEQEHTQEDPHLLTCPVSISPVVHSNYVTVLFAFADESTYYIQCQLIAKEEVLPSELSLRQSIINNN